MRPISAPRRVVAVAVTAAAVTAGLSACGTASQPGAARDTAGRASADASHAAGATVAAGAIHDGARGQGQQAAQSASRTPASTAAAAPARPAAAQVAAQAVQRGLLREFLTVDNQGYFYTGYTPEATAAVRTFHFSPTGATFGYLDSWQVKGTIPLYRLHVVGRQAYIVTPDAREKNSLLASHRFTLDGVLGYIATRQAAGTFAIWRLGKGPQPYWRLATTAQEKALVSQGWHLDGLVGFVWAKA